MRISTVFVWISLGVFFTTFFLAIMMYISGQVGDEFWHSIVLSYVYAALCLLEIASVEKKIEDKFK